MDNLRISVSDWFCFLSSICIDEMCSEWGRHVNWGCLLQACRPLSSPLRSYTTQMLSGMRPSTWPWAQACLRMQSLAKSHQLRSQSLTTKSLEVSYCLHLHWYEPLVIFMLGCLATFNRTKQSFCGDVSGFRNMVMIIPQMLNLYHVLIKFY